jgi:hypothetical protein
MSLRQAITCERAERGGIFQSRERYKFGYVAFIEAPCFFIGDIGEPFGFGGYVGEVTVLFQRECLYAIDTD